MSLAETITYPTLSCMLLPLSGYDALLPKSIVKEVVYKPKTQFFDDEGDWLIGDIDWQDYIVPLISFELLCNQPRASKPSHVRAVVCHAMYHTDAFPFLRYRGSINPSSVNFGQSSAA